MFLLSIGPRSSALKKHFSLAILKYEESMNVRFQVSIAKVAISIDRGQLKKVDLYVKKRIFKNRSQAFQLSISEMLQHIEHNRLAKECEKLDKNFEQDMAELGLDGDLAEWDKY